MQGRQVGGSFCLRPSEKKRKCEDSPSQGTVRKKGEGGKKKGVPSPKILPSTGPQPLTVLILPDGRGA